MGVTDVQHARNVVDHLKPALASAEELFNRIAADQPEPNVYVVVWQTSHLQLRCEVFAEEANARDFMTERCQESTTECAGIYPVAFGFLDPNRELTDEEVDRLVDALKAEDDATRAAG